MDGVQALQGEGILGGEDFHTEEEITNLDSFLGLHGTPPVVVGTAEGIISARSVGRNSRCFDLNASSVGEHTMRVSPAPTALDVDLEEVDLVVEDQGRRLRIIGSARMVGMALEGVVMVPEEVVVGALGEEVDLVEVVVVVVRAEACGYYRTSEVRGGN